MYLREEIDFITLGEKFWTIFIPFNNRNISRFLSANYPPS